MNYLEDFRLTFAVFVIESTVDLELVWLFISTKTTTSFENKLMKYADGLLFDSLNILSDNVQVNRLFLVVIFQ